MEERRYISTILERYRLHPLVVVFSHLKLQPSTQQTIWGYVQLKTTVVVVSHQFKVNVNFVHVSTVYLAHHQTHMKLIQVTKIDGKDTDLYTCNCCQRVCTFIQ
jgi:hypothetical protein